MGPEFHGVAGVAGVQDSGVVSGNSVEGHRGDLARAELVRDAVYGYAARRSSVELELVVTVGAVHSHRAAVVAEQVGQAEIDVGITPGQLQVVHFARRGDLPINPLTAEGRCRHVQRRIGSPVVVQRQLDAFHRPLKTCFQREHSLARRLDAIPELPGRRVQIVEFQEGDRAQGLRHDESGRVLVVGDFAGEQVAVLVQRHAGSVQDLRTDNHRIRACHPLRIELDIEGLWIQPVVAGREDGALRADEAENVVGQGEALIVHRPIEIEPDGPYRP